MDFSKSIEKKIHYIAWMRYFVSLLVVLMYVAVFTIYFLLDIGNELIAFFVPKNMFFINSYLFCIVCVI